VAPCGTEVDVTRWVVIGIGAGCTGGGTKPTPVDSGSPSDTVVNSTTYVFTSGGTACVTSDGTGITEVTVDFGECWFCSTGTVECTATLAGTQLTVEASGEVVVATECASTDGTCEPVSAVCTGPDVPPGTYDLVYDGTTVPLVVPTTDPVCAP
jgi:hypothetical protein